MKGISGLRRTWELLVILSISIKAFQKLPLKGLAVLGCIWELLGPKAQVYEFL